MLILLEEILKLAAIWVLCIIYININRATYIIDPWKPVPKKKHVPKAPSLIVKDETLYSTPWKTVNIIANNTVAIDPYKAPFLSPYIKEWTKVSRTH